jgi:hypothetical protein
MQVQGVCRQSVGGRQAGVAGPVRCLLGVALAGLLVLVRLGAQSPTMSVAEVRAGMVGEGWTVFSGTTRESFNAHILGVMENVLGPRRSLVLARLEGGPLAQSGVIAGMSGSPVYIDGRLIGAVAYSLGSFSREPIAGITPIAEMTDMAGPGPARVQASRVALRLPVSHEGLQDALREAFAGTAFAMRREDVREASGHDLARWSTQLRPIATPLAISGVSPDALTTLSTFFRDTGFVPVAGAASAGSTVQSAVEPLRPGDAVGVSLVSGDLALGATGTVTAVDHGMVYAFGHPFYNLGPTAFPMTRAWVHAVLPSLFSSVKLSSLGEVIGTFEQDRSTAIAGRLGAGPRTIPMGITLEGARGQKRSFSLRIADDQLFTPLLTYVSILSVLQSYEREVGAATFEVKGRARVRGYDAVALEDIFAGDQPSIPAAAYVATPLTALLRNDKAPVQIEGVDVTISATEQPRTSTLERIWVDDPRIRAGGSVTLKMLTRSWRGDDEVRTLEIPIPQSARSPLTLLVADGARMAQWEQREWRRVQDAQNVGQMIRAFNDSRRSSRLYVRLIAQSPGAVVQGEPMPALPPSVLGVLDSDQDAGRFAPLRQAVVGEWDVRVGQVVVGSRTLTLAVEPR